MKIRLVKGPFGGKVMEHPASGQNTIKMRGPKKMTREQRYRHEYEKYKNMSHSYYDPLPQVEALYRIAMRPHVANNGADGPQMAYLYCMHPDGSIFYEYVENSKKEF